MSAALLYGLVILSAIAHAVWNALVKSAGDRTLTMVAIRTVGMMLGLVALPFVDWPAPESWKWLALTAVVMFAYYALLVRSYGIGDMSVVYPLARGLAPVLTTIAAFLVIGEALSTGQVAAVVMISIGIMALSLRRRRQSRSRGLCAGDRRLRRDLQLLRRAGRAHRRHRAGLPGLPGDRHRLRHGWLWRRRAARRPRRSTRAVMARSGLFAGVVSVLGFLAYLVAARSLPLGPVSALRETSVIFGAVLGTIVLKEGFGPRRIAAAMLVTVGIVLLAMLR